MRFQQLLSRRHSDERGAVAIMVATLTIVLFMIAALAVDITYQVQRKNLLQNQLDAAATAAAYYLGTTSSNGLAQAVAAAKNYYDANGYSEGWDPHKVDFWCVVSRDEATTSLAASQAYPKAYQIPRKDTTATGVCNPDAVSADSTGKFVVSQYQNRPRATWDSSPTQYYNMTCNAALCAIPCGLQAKPDTWAPGKSLYNNLPITCNTIRIGADQGVPFSFAPAGGIKQGGTGALVAVACKGPCGAIAANPMNIVVVTDRTGSMAEADLNSLIAGVRDMLGVTTPDVQFVSLGTIGRSDSSNRNSFSKCSTLNGLDNDANTTSGTTDMWVPLKFYNDFLTAGTGSSLNSSSKLVQALDCLDPYLSGAVEQSSGTFLAAPLKAAARYVLGPGYDSTSWNVNSELSGNSRSGAVKNVIIFETDGQPYEVTASATSSCGNPTNLTTTQTIGTTSNLCGNGYDVFSDYRTATSTTSSIASPTVTTATCPSNQKPINGASDVCPETYNPVYSCTNGYTVGTSAGTTGFEGFCWSSVTGYSNSTSCNNANSSYDWGNPTNSSGTKGCWRKRGLATVTTNSITYSTETKVTTSLTSSTYTGGQTACSNFDSVADTFKALSENNLVITVGYNLNSGTLCGDNNRSYNSKMTGISQTTPKTGTPTTKLTQIADTSGNSLLSNSSCVNSTGSGSNRTYTLLTGCARNVVLTYTITRTDTQSQYVQGPNNDAVTDTLASAAGGQGLDPSTANFDCSADSGRTSENGDGDYFFCAASGDDMGSIFITALSQVNTGIKLIKMP